MFELILNLSIVIDRCFSLIAEERNDWIGGDTKELFYSQKYKKNEDTYGFAIVESCF